MEIKKYFYDRVRTIKFGIYAITLNKKRVYEQLAKDKSHVYNYVTRRVLDQIPFEMNEWQRVQLIIDRSKGKPEIEDFNSYIGQQLKGRLNPKTPLDIYHLRSHDTPGLQVADMFCWGVFQKYERGKKEWYDIFKEKILYDKPFL